MYSISEYTWGIRSTTNTELKSTPETTPEFGAQDDDDSTVDVLAEDNVSTTLEH
jgi:hypothetical protein